MLKRELSDWPGGVESVWPLLDAESVRALRAGTPPDNRALRVSSELEEEELAGSAFVGNAMVLLRAVAEGGERLRVTSNGTLSLASVARMRAATIWPDMEATEHFREGTKYRERDLWELQLLRRMVQKAGLIERGARSFELTAQGRRMLDAGNRGALQALLFRVFFWHMDLSLFVGWLARRVPGPMAAERHRSGVVGARRCGRRMAERRHARGVVHRSREPGSVWVPGAAGDAVPVTRSCAAVLVRSDGMEGDAGDVRRSALAQDRFV